MLFYVISENKNIQGNILDFMKGDFELEVTQYTKENEMTCISFKLTRYPFAEEIQNNAESLIQSVIQSNS